MDTTGLRMLVKVLAAVGDAGATDQLLGKNVFIRTVTYHYTGRLAAVTHDEYVLDDAAWVASSGRFANALLTGELSDVEPYPGQCRVSRAAVVDRCEWLHPLPREVI